MRKLIFGIYFLLNTWFSLKAQLPVVFGELDSSRYGYSICFDKKGNVYPESFIPDPTLQAAGGDLFQLFKRCPDLFLKISTQYSCFFTSWEEENFRTLQDSIIQRKIFHLLNVNRDSSLTFLIHGFRKAFRDTLSDWTSTRDHAFVRHTFKNSPTRFIEIYWDAEYGCCFGTNSKRNKELFQLFEEAQQTADLVGKSLSRILDAMDNRNVNIIAHSLGAKVSIQACATVHSSNFTCLLIAPAIDYKYLSEKIRHSNCKNQRWVIVYNRHDFVLKKKDPVLGIFGPGPFRYGITTLGCNHRRAIYRLRGEISKNDFYTELYFENFSSIGKHHHLRTYLSSKKTSLLHTYIR